MSFVMEKKRIIASMFLVAVLGCPAEDSAESAGLATAPDSATEPPANPTDGSYECGNGEIEESWDDSEVCDDGPDNGWDKHGCSPYCTPLYCGDGLLQPQSEECDDGSNGDQEDGCNDGCTLPKCGDGYLQKGEECDDGEEYNLGEYNGCNANCSRAPHCGDGEVLPGYEKCDDGNEIGTDACTTECLPATCGDDYVHEGVEECDEGHDPEENAENDWDECSNACEPHTEGCGNGVIEDDYDHDERCDDGDYASGDGCSSTCQLESCGDGIEDPSEDCDDGNLMDNDGCTSTCHAEYCGDGVVQPGEKCDDGKGNDYDYNGCLPYYCKFGSRCGDGKVDSNYEKCDDGNQDSCDGCSAKCKVEECGNDTLECDEECDDGDWNGYRCPAACSKTCNLMTCATSATQGGCSPR